MLDVSYVLPIAAGSSQAQKLSGYLMRLGRTIDDVIVVDGSPPEIFSAHATSWSRFVRHLRPDVQMTNGKVAGAMTGVRAARHDRIIIADDDVRYRRAAIVSMHDLLDSHDVVRPQNFFWPLPWHARWDTARSLLNRLAGGDWPGTLGVRRSKLLAAGGYSGEALFENLELVRTICAAGGREKVALDLFVARRPPSAGHFLSQRVRQAYDEWARPARLVAQLAILPAALAMLILYPPGLALGVTGVIAAAELGRRTGKGATVFPTTSALWAPLWIAERGVTSWIAFGTRLFFGGVLYRGKRVKEAATPMRKLIAQIDSAKRRTLPIRSA